MSTNVSVTKTKPGKGKNKEKKAAAKTLKKMAGKKQTRQAKVANRRAKKK